MSGARLAFQYLFCIFNAFQGLVIFLLHNIRDPKVTAWWRKVLHLESVKAMRTTSASTSTYLSKKSNYSRSTSVSDTLSQVPMSTSTTDTLSELPKRDSSKFSDLAGSVKSSNPSTKKIAAPEVTKKYLQLQQSKLMHSSTESDRSQASVATVTSSGTVTSADTVTSNF